MPKPAIDYEQIETYILVMLYDAFVSDKDPSFSVQRIRNRISVPANVVRACLENLESKHFVSERTKARNVPDTSITGSALGRMLTEHTPTGQWELTKRGRQQVESFDDDIYDEIQESIEAHKGADVFVAAGSLAFAAEGWEPLQIDRTEPEVVAIEEALDEALTAIRADNGYASAEPTERAEILAALSGLETVLSDATLFTYSALQAHVAMPLERLARRFSINTVVGKAGAFLWSAVCAWIKKRAGIVLDQIFGGE